VTAYIDGSCIGNPGPGGWGYTMRRGDKVRENYGHLPDTTNNRMELQAAIEALSIIKAGSVVEVFTDSQYVQKGITAWITGWKARGWRTAVGASVVNKDLWQRLEEVAGAHRVTWRWVKAHAGDPGNERADALAQRGARLAMKCQSPT
jgi:ribonuclease HI